MGRFTWVSQEFLEANDMRPWSMIPLWAPSNGPLAGFHHRSIVGSEKAAIAFRPIDVTVKDTLEFYRAWPEERRANLPRGIKPERRVELLAKWLGGARAKISERVSRTGALGRRIAYKARRPARPIGSDRPCPFPRASSPSPRF